ncbi:hypothetical protein [Phaffia rhodozyma]|uniref:Uncharacterized protein n=1 Tax=Phaffia rhodozyma TaxID=264483 RepID=A0A0F7SLB1_PHARH|nr:hypothetical protein [Phaffia rhodozyma]
MLHRSLAHTFHDKENTYHLPSRTPLRIGLAGSSFATAGARTVGRPNVKTPFTKTSVLLGGKPPQTTQTGRGKEKIWTEGGVNLGNSKTGEGKDGQMIEPRRLFTLQTNRGSPKASGTLQLNSSSKDGALAKPNSNQPPPTLKKSRPAPTPQHVLRTPHPTQRTSLGQSHSPTQQLTNILSTPLPSTNRTRRRSKQLHTPLSSSTSSNNLSRSPNKSSNVLSTHSPSRQVDPGFSTPAARMRYPVVDFEIEDPDVLGAGPGLGELVEENVLEIEEEDDEIEEMNRGFVDEPFELPYDTLDMTDLGQRVRSTAIFLGGSSFFDLPPPVDIVLDDDYRDGSLDLNLKDLNSDEELYVLLNQPRCPTPSTISARANSNSRDSRSTCIGFSSLPPSVLSTTKRDAPSSASNHLSTVRAPSSTPSVSRRPLSSVSTSSKSSATATTKTQNGPPPTIRPLSIMSSTTPSASSLSGSKIVRPGAPSALRQSRATPEQKGVSSGSARLNGKSKWAALQARDHRLGRELLAGLATELDQDQTHDDLFEGFEF